MQLNIAIMESFVPTFDFSGLQDLLAKRDDWRARRPFTGVLLLDFGKSVRIIVNR